MIVSDIKCFKQEGHQSWRWSSVFWNRWLHFIQSKEPGQGETLWPGSWWSLADYEVSVSEHSRQGSKASQCNCFFHKNNPDQEFLIGHHPEDTEQDIVIACGFNGGGFQMGPMVARLAIGCCLTNQMSASQLSGLLPPCKVVENQDYDVDSVDLTSLLESMARKFDPDRANLKQFLNAF